jgi:hypothetical protein
VTELTFASEDHFRFARSFFVKKSRYDPTWDRATLTADFPDPIVRRLFERINTGKAVILPSFNHEQDRWLVAARTATEIDQIVSRLKGFLFPTYVRFAEPRWQAFESKSTDCCRFGQRLFKTGYYTLVSSAKQREKILGQLDRWMILEDARPTLARPQRLTYRNIITDFEYALTAEDWKGAEDLIYIARRAHLTTADNSAFLEFRLLAEQAKWSDILEDKQYEHLTLISIPRKVREIMLRAFHEMRIAEREKVSWEEGYQAFANEYTMVGNLLSTRSDLRSAAVLKVFAYQAVLRQDAELIRELIDESGGILGEQLEQISRLIRQPQKVQPYPDELSSFELAKIQLREARYDHAWQSARQIESRKQRVTLLLQIATSSYDREREELAYLEYRKCSEKQQREIVKDAPILKYFLEAQESSYLERELEAAQVLNVETLFEWFDATKNDPSHPSLGDALEQIFLQEDVKQLAPSQIDLLFEMLVQFSEPEFRSKTYVETFIKKLTTLMIEDEQYPRDNTGYVELYQGLFESVLALDQNERNLTILLRLIEGILQARPERRDIYFNELRDHVTFYNPTLFPLLQELFEMFTSHGIKSEQLTLWLNEVLEELVRQRIQYAPHSLIVWEELAEWAHCRSDLLSKLKDLQEAADVSEEQSSIPQLKKGFKILIFMLNERTAQRVKNYIQRLNHRVDVNIYSQPSPNADVQRAAQNADMIVLVTACIKHAISYAIEPITDKEKRIYPGKSQGSSAIINAIEEHIERTC